MLKALIESYLQKKRHRGKTRLVRILLKMLPYKSIRTHYGVILNCNPTDKTNIYAISGDYGHMISDHIQTLPKDSIFIDIGANYGLYSNLAAKRLNNGKVFSFEPNPYIYRHFLLALEKNGFKNITPFHCAIGESDEFLKLSYDKKHSGISSLKNTTDNDQNSFTVPVFNISKWNILKSLESLNNIHIKIDVEGYETSIINTLQSAPWYKNVQSIIVEIDNKNLKSFGSSAKKLYDILEKNGFTPQIGFDENKHYDEKFVRS